METHLNKAQRRIRRPEPEPMDSLGLEREWKDLEDTLREFRDSAHAAAERPETFWESQRSAISMKLQHPVQASWCRPAWIWVPVAAGVLLCLFLFVEQGQAPIPDFAAGSDQELLTDVERSLDQQYPAALEPITLITGEMEQDEQATSPLE